MRAGGFVFVVVVRGIGSVTDALVQGDEALIPHAFLNMKMIANPFTMEGFVFRRHVGTPGEELFRLVRVRHLSARTKRIAVTPNDARQGGTPCFAEYSA